MSKRGNCRHPIFDDSYDLDAIACTPDDESICLPGARSPQWNATALSPLNPTPLLSHSWTNPWFFKPAASSGLPATYRGCRPSLLVAGHQCLLQIFCDSCASYLQRCMHLPPRLGLNVFEGDSCSLYIEGLFPMF